MASEDDVSDTPRTDRYLAQRVACGADMSWEAFAQKLERDLRECVAALEYALEASWDGISDPVWAEKARQAVKKARLEK
jgi:hypothetical protein